jgi:DNA-binding transcriptional regulator YdaS (Cro superfamily)
MSLNDYIKAAAARTGGQKQLAELLHQTPSSLTSAKMLRRGLPLDACIKIAQLIDVEPLEVIAASELATEKKEEKRAFWHAFLAGNMQVARMLIASAVVCYALAPAPAEANTKTGTICIMSTIGTVVRTILK